MLASIDQLITEIQEQRNAKFGRESARSRAKWSSQEEALFEQVPAIARSWLPASAATTNYCGVSSPARPTSKSERSTVSSSATAPAGSRRWSRKSAGPGGRPTSTASSSRTPTAIPRHARLPLRPPVIYRPKVYPEASRKPTAIFGSLSTINYQTASTDGLVACVLSL